MTGAGAGIYEENRPSLDEEYLARSTRVGAWTSVAKWTVVAIGRKSNARDYEPQPSLPGAEGSKEEATRGPIEAWLRPAVSTVVRRVAIRNFKSIASCNVHLGPLQLLCGPNGAGKSNFLDALRFVADGLNHSLEQALRDRGGIDQVRRISRGHPRNFAIRLDLQLNRIAARGHYAFEISSRPNGAFSVRREECMLQTGEGRHHFRIEDGELKSASRSIPTLIESDRLALATISGLPEFRALYDSLRHMRFYNLSPERIRDLQDPDPGRSLARDGRNLAAVIRELGKPAHLRALEEIREHLAAVVPGVESVEHRSLGPKETLEFRQAVAGDPNPWRFMANSMSDGTLRALGILAATLGAGEYADPIPLVGIEKPETALHPGAADIVAGVLLLASQRVQILVTTHSPELLDNKEIQDSHLLAVTAESGRTIVAPLGEVPRSVLREHLRSAGELLSMGQLQSGAEEIASATRQLSLFSNTQD